MTDTYSPPCLFVQSMMAKQDLPWDAYVDLNENSKQQALRCLLDMQPHEKKRDYLNGYLKHDLGILKKNISVVGAILGEQADVDYAQHVLGVFAWSEIDRTVVAIGMMETMFEKVKREGEGCVKDFVHELCGMFGRLPEMLNFYAHPAGRLLIEALEEGYLQIARWALEHLHKDYPRWLEVLRDYESHNYKMPKFPDIDESTEAQLWICLWLGRNQSEKRMQAVDEMLPPTWFGVFAQAWEMAYHSAPTNVPRVMAGLEKEMLLEHVSSVQQQRRMPKI